MTGARVVAFGGGHGLAATLKALRRVTTELTAVVTVADNGGSSGRLRAEFNALPPGDLRMALAALCGDDEWGKNWADLMQYRFTSNGSLDGHALGNLLLAALWDRDGDPVAGLKRVGELLQVVGRVLPMALDPLDIEATFLLGDKTEVINGQKEVALGAGELAELRLIPPVARTTPEVLEAISTAEWLTFGPGSWISSVLPHLLLKDARNAISAASARKVLILNLPSSVSAVSDELASSTPIQHIEQLHRFAPELQIDIALCDQQIANDSHVLQELTGLVQSLGGVLIVRDLAVAPGAKDHHPDKLASVFADIFNGRVLR